MYIFCKRSCTEKDEPNIFFKADVFLSQGKLIHFVSRSGHESFFPKNYWRYIL